MLRVAIFASVRTVMLVAFAVAALMVVTLIVERLEVPVTLRAVPKTDAALIVVTLVVDRLEVPVTLRAVPKIDTALMVVTLIVERFDAPLAFIVEQEMKGIVKVSKLKIIFVEFDENPVVYKFAIFASYMLAVFPKYVEAFNVAVLTVTMFAYPSTFAFPDAIRFDVTSAFETYTLPST